MIPEKKLFKNVEMLISEDQLLLLGKMLEEPGNAWLQVSLQPIIETDSNGLIVLFKPIHQMNMNLLYFIQNLMIAQRLYLVDELLRKNGIIV